MNKKVVLTFVRLSTLSKIAFYKNVVDLMTNNPNFPTPEVALSELTAIVGKMESAYFEFKNGSHLAKANLDMFTVQADELFRKQANYVTRIANGNESIIISSGFEASKDSTPRQHTDFQIKDGEKPGSFELKKLAEEGAKSYLWHMHADTIPSNEKEWEVAGITTQSSIEINGLISGTRYWFRVAPITPEGVGTFTQPQSRVSQ